MEFKEILIKIWHFSNTQAGRRLLYMKDAQKKLEA